MTAYRPRRLAAVAVLALALAGCNDTTSSPSPDSGRVGAPPPPANGGGRIGAPEEITISELGPADVRNSIAAACGNPEGAPGCLTLRYVTEADPDASECNFLRWESVPPKVSVDNTNSRVRRGSTIIATFRCPPGVTPDTGATPEPSPSETDTPEPTPSETETPEPSPSETG